MKHILLGLLILISTASLISQSLNSPFETVYNHLQNLEDDSRNIEKSAQSFHPSIDLQTRMDLAENLKRVLDAKGIFIYINSIPKNENYRDSLSGNEVYHITEKLPEITVERYGDRWYYSKSMVRDVPRLFKQTFPYWSLALINAIPESMKAKLLGVALWKIIGFFIILIGALLLYKILEKIIDKVILKFISDKVSTDPKGLHAIHRVARYSGLFLFIVILTQLFPLLMFDIKVSKPLFRGLGIMGSLLLMMVALRVVDIVSSYFRRVAEQTDTRMDNQLLPILSKTAKVLLAIFFIARILVLLDVNVTALVAGLSIGGLALALAAQDTVKNLLGSVMIFFDRPFQVGDFVQAQGVEGTVEEVGFRSSRIRKADTSLITIPNGNITTSHTVNYGARKARMMELTLGFTYDSKPENLVNYKAKVLEYLATLDYINQENKIVNLRNLSASSIDIYFRIFIQAATFQEELDLREQTILKLMELAHLNDLSFAFPSTSVYIENDKS